MRKSWILLFVAIVIAGGFLGISYSLTHQKPAEKLKCPANDVVMYPDGDIKATYFCPAEGQQLTVVREVNYKTYIRCSCPK